MSDYKAFYECEQRRADKAEDELITLRGDLAEARAKLVTAQAFQQEYMRLYQAAKETTDELRYQLRLVNRESIRKTIPLAARNREGFSIPKTLNDMPVADWHHAALIAGEFIATTGPDNYYQFTPEEWLEWVLSLSQPADAQKESKAEVEEKKASLLPISGPGGIDGFVLICPFCGYYSRITYNRFSSFDRCEHFVRLADDKADSSSYLFQALFRRISDVGY